MRLFSRLLQFQTNIVQSEDFFTEIVAHLLRHTDNLLIDWVQQLGLGEIDPETPFEIETQAIFDQGKRPDVVITFFSENNTEKWVIMIESKLGSAEGGNQLNNYAHILAQQYKRVPKKTLLYITRDYDPKKTPSILKKIPAGTITFQQYRWYHFYQFLKPQRNENPLIDEVCAYMEEQQMAQRNQFSPTDILALNQMPQSFALMNETLFGEVSGRINELFGTVSTPLKALQELRKQEFLVFSYLIHRTYWVGVGYKFDGSAYPKCGLVSGVNPNREHGKEILEAFHAISERDGWEGVNLNKRSGQRIYALKPLNDFLQGEDHVRAVKDYFLSLLDQWMMFTEQYPVLGRPLSNHEPKSSSEEE